MKRSWLVALLVFLFLILLSIILFVYFFNRDIPIDNESYVLIDDLNVEVYSEIKLSSLIKNIEGEILEDTLINTNKLGLKKIEFLYENSKGRKRRGQFSINVVDTTEPFILLGNSYTVTVGYDKDLTSILLSADNYDSSPKREIIGEYDFNTVGSYPLQYKVTDSSGNVESVDFTLNVKAKSSGSSSNVSSINFNDVISAHKNDGTKIGIDVSKWQGNIDFEKLKNSGVEFIIIRVGTGLGFDADSVEDPYFKQNIEGAKKAGIPVGVYYYSYATSVKEAIRQANFVIDLVKDYKLDLPIVFDWESWSYFNSLNLSIHDINEVANAFLSEVEKAGYKGMLYGSKYYLQWIWDTDYPVWLAHYTNQTDYENEYDIWQLCDTGRVAGINGYVDINVMYKDYIN